MDLHEAIVKLGEQITEKLSEAVAEVNSLGDRRICKISVQYVKPRDPEVNPDGCIWEWQVKVEREFCP